MYLSGKILPYIPTIGQYSINTYALGCTVFFNLVYSPNNVYVLSFIKLSDTTFVPNLFDK